MTSPISHGWNQTRRLKFIGSSMFTWCIISCCSKSARDDPWFDAAPDHPLFQTDKMKNGTNADYATPGLSLWKSDTWLAFECLDLNTFSQRLQGTDIPSKWFASMWSFMFLWFAPFSANIANIEKLSMLSLSWTFCHQRLDLFIKFLRVARVFIC